MINLKRYIKGFTLFLIVVLMATHVNAGGGYGERICETNPEPVDDNSTTIAGITYIL